MTGHTIAAPRGRRTLSDTPGFNTGVVAGIVVVYLGMVGMIEAFSERPIITGYINFGPLLILLIFYFFAYAAIGRPANQTAEFQTGITVGGIGGLLTGVFLILVEIGETAGYQVRDVFISISPTMRDVLSFGFGPYVGTAVLTGVGSLMGVLAVLTRRLQPELRASVFSALSILMISALGATLFRVMLDGLGIPTRWLYRNDGLTLIGTVVILALAIGIRLYVRRQGGTRRVALSLPGATEKNLPRVLIGLIGIALMALPWIVNTFVSDVLGTVGLYILLGLGLNIVVGFAGLLDLGYVAFYAVGAYVTAILTSHASYLVTDNPLRPSPDTFTNFWIAIPITVVIAVFIGLIIGAPVLRLRGDYLAIVTLGFGEIIRILVTSDWLKPYLGGPQGVTDAERVPFFGLNTRDPRILYYLILAFALFAVFVSMRVKDSRVGRAWAAMREDEDIAEGMGVSVIKYKLLAFAMGAAIGCLGGAFFAAKLSVANPGSFTLLVSINVLAVVVLGGIGSIPGVVVGSLVLVGLPELLREFGEFRLHIYGAIIIAIMVLRPEGLIPDKRRAMELHATEVHESAGPLSPAATEGM
ncbi:MAG TPA: leucine/isoleucine/valine transporter permease subunit [Acidimicrobiia bacterium]|nr:leucine/isoleucine/valine transporter permease subunit [Acidimicrobiia bacterium]